VCAPLNITESNFLQKGEFYGLCSSVLALEFPVTLPWCSSWSRPPCSSLAGHCFSPSFGFLLSLCNPVPWPQCSYSSLTLAFLPQHSCCSSDLLLLFLLRFSPMFLFEFCSCLSFCSCSYWSLLVLAGSCWFLLVLVGSCWFLLVLVGSC
jgi:hypothetical protein